MNYKDTMSYLRNEQFIKQAAITLCKRTGDDPYRLEPGNTPYHDDDEVIDGVLPNGDIAHYAWRGHVNAAIDALQEAKLDSHGRC